MRVPNLNDDEFHKYFCIPYLKHKKVIKIKIITNETEKEINRYETAKVLT